MRRHFDIIIFGLKPNDGERHEKLYDSKTSRTKQRCAINFALPSITSFRGRPGEEEENSLSAIKLYSVMSNWCLQQIELQERKHKTFYTVAEIVFHRYSPRECIVVAASTA